MDTYDIFRKITYGTQFKRDVSRKKFNKSSSELTGKEKQFEQLVAKPLNLGVSNENPVLSNGLKSKIGNHDSNIHENGKFLLFAKTKGSSPVGLKKKIKMTKAKLARIKQEEITHFRRSHHIYVYGSDIPDPIENFEQLHTDYSLSSLVLNNIADLGYSTPTPIQMQAVPLLLHNRQILACAPTGSGKTAAFLIPLIQLLKGPKKSGVRALIVSPTRELAKQISRECVRLSEGTNLRILVIDKVKISARKLEPNSSKKIDILISTPNRLIYMLQQDPPVISLERVEWLIIDESDKLFEDGKQGFRDQLAVIYKACNYVNIKRAMFSATFSHDVEEWCKLNLVDLTTLSVGIRNTAVETVQQSLLFVGNESGKLLAFRDLVKKGLSPPVLVFVQSKERAKELFNELVYDGINVDVIHADRTQLQRDNVVRSFRSGHIWVLICTEIMGRGIDFKGVNLVINYDFPPSAISYIHRIGRTGRAGLTGCAITYFTEDDRENLRSIAQVMKNAGCDVPDYMLRLKKKSKQKNEVPRPIKRVKISTVPEYDIEKKANLKKFIQNSKRRESRKKKALLKDGKKSLL